MTKDAIARERIRALTALVAQRFDAVAGANKLALDAAEKAVLKAENASEKRFEAVNEFRATLSDQASRFITRVEMDARLEAVNTAIGRLDKSAATTSGRGIGMNQLWGVIVGGGGLVVAMLALVFAVLK